MPSPITPPALEPGATIAWISPSARLNSSLPAVMARANAVLSERGYRTKTFFSEDAGIQSSIQNRLAEIRAAFSDPDVSAIICTIGGTTFTELLPALMDDTDLHSTIRANPKIVVGYSDISGLHWFLHAFTGLRTFYGPGAFPELGEASSTSDANSPLAFCVENLFRAIAKRAPLGEVSRSLQYATEPAPFFSEPDSLKTSRLAPTGPWVWLRPGKGKGRLFGGCLTVVARLHGTRHIVPDWRGRIVFLESAGSDDDKGGNPLFRVQAAFADLISAGVFEDVAGLVIGRAVGYNTEQERKDYADVVRGLFCEGRLAKKPFPILMNVDIGHAPPIVTLPYDALASLDSERDSFAILESGVQ